MFGARLPGSGCEGLRSHLMNFAKWACAEFAIVVVTCVLAPIALSQEAARPATQPAGRGARGGFFAPVRSPEVAADRRVTFRLRAPNAKEVLVLGIGPAGRLAMEKDEQGVWSITTEPMK